MSDADRRECALCGADKPALHVVGVQRWHGNRRGEFFCCRSHRDQSNRQLREFLKQQEQRP